MKTHRLTIILVVSTVLLILVPAARADSIILTLTGSVQYVDSSLSGVFNTSQTLLARLTIDLDTPGLYEEWSPGSGYSDYPHAITRFEVSVGPYAAADPTIPPRFSGIQIINAPTRGGINGGGMLTGPQINGFYPEFFFGVDGAVGTAFGDTDLAHVSDLDRFLDSGPFFNLWYFYFGDYGGPGADASITGSLTSASVTSVPEPTSLLLLCTGLGGIALAVWRGKK